MTLRYRLTKEEWKPVVGYENEYMVSSFGRVRSLRMNKVMRPSHSGPYDHVTLIRPGKREDKTIHRLVAEAFLDNPNGYKVVNHLDEDKRNNRADNLEWCTVKHNNTYGVAALSRNQPVRQYDLKWNLIREWESIQSAERATGIKYQNISRCCRMGRKSAGGYRWRYVGTPRKWAR